jgi:hypothetical protein
VGRNKSSLTVGASVMETSLPAAAAAAAEGTFSEVGFWSSMVWLGVLSACFNKGIRLQNPMATTLVGVESPSLTQAMRAKREAPFLAVSCPSFQKRAPLSPARDHVVTRRTEGQVAFLLRRVRVLRVTIPRSSITALIGICCRLCSSPRKNVMISRQSTGCLRNGSFCSAI